MDGFYGSYYSTGDHQYHHNYEDNKALLPSENLLTPLTVYHHDPQHHYNSYHFPVTEHHQDRDDDVISPVLGPSDQELRFQSSCSGVAVSEPPDRREGVVHGQEQISHGRDRKQVSSLMKAKIASHPSYPKLLSAYIDCQKVGAPLEMITLLDQIRREADHLYDQESVSASSLGDDPELDEFMETFCEVLFKCRSDLSRPFDEATAFLNTVESQLANLTCNDESAILLLSSDEEETILRSEISIQDLQMKNEDHRKMKEMLLRRYGGSSHFGRLKMLFSNNKKKVKLPKEARQALLDWWNLHYKWPYPTEADKISLAESTGLDQKQINNWFINQRKRHWKSSDSMHLTMMDNYATHFFNED